MQVEEAVALPRNGVLPASSKKGGGQQLTPVIPKLLSRVSVPSREDSHWQGVLEQPSPRMVSLLGEVPPVPHPRLGCLGESDAGCSDWLLQPTPWAHPRTHQAVRCRDLLGRADHSSGWHIFAGDPLVSGKLPLLPPLSYTNPGYQLTELSFQASSKTSTASLATRTPTELTFRNR